MSMEERFRSMLEPDAPREAQEAFEEHLKSARSQLEALIAHRGRMAEEKESKMREKQDLSDMRGMPRQPRGEAINRMNESKLRFAGGPRPRDRQAELKHDFIRAYGMMEAYVHGIAVSKGFWDAPRDDGTCIALMHSELSELLEALRHGNPDDEHVPQFSSAEVELADAVIRIMDFANARGYKVAQAIVAKSWFNESRPHKHGKEF